MNFKNLNPPQAKLNQLLKYYQERQFTSAEKMALTLTKEYPNHPFAWKVLGAIFSLTGRLAQAVEVNKKSIALSPSDAEAYNNLGNTFNEIGKTLDAKESYEKAIELKPEFAEPYYNLGNVLNSLGQTHEAEESFKKTISLKPDHIKSYNNLGVILQDSDRLDEAVAMFKKAIGLNPNFAEAYSNLANSLKELGRLAEAEAISGQAIFLKPNYAEAHFGMGNILYELGNLEGATKHYKKAINLKADYATAYNNLGTTLEDLGQFEEAVINYTKAIELNPKFSVAYNNLGNIFKSLGRIEDAKINISKALMLNPDYAASHYNLTIIKKFNSKDEQFHQMQKLCLDKTNSDKNLCFINFGLAKAYEDLGDYEMAFHHFNNGNAIRKKLLKYNFHEDIELFNQIIKHSKIISEYSLNSNTLKKSITPIFIVGMPRSGTTLVEQIISSHQMVSAAGELTFVANFGEGLVRGKSIINEESLLKFREKYLQKLMSFAKGKLFVTDKMPLNFRYIGLIVSALPEAKIINVNRDPAALCWANYKQYFSKNGLGFSYDLENVISYFNLYKNLMFYWKSEVGCSFYDLSYELLVEEQETETRKLIDYLGLNWDSKCLSPENNQNAVSTASSLQVRRKVYQGSSQKWKNYEPFLKGKLNSIYLN